MWYLSKKIAIQLSLDGYLPDITQKLKRANQTDIQIQILNAC